MKRKDINALLCLSNYMIIHRWLNAPKPLIWLDTCRQTAPTIGFLQTVIVPGHLNFVQRAPSKWCSLYFRPQLEEVANLTWRPQFNYIKVETGRSKPLNLLRQTEGSVNIGDHYRKQGPILDGKNHHHKNLIVSNYWCSLPYQISGILNYDSNPFNRITLAKAVKVPTIDFG